MLFFFFCPSVFPEIFLCHTTPTPLPSSAVWSLHSKCYSYREHHGGPAQKQFPHEICGVAFENPLHFLETAGCGQDTCIMATSSLRQPVTSAAHTASASLKTHVQLLMAIKFLMKRSSSAPLRSFCLTMSGRCRPSVKNASGRLSLHTLTDITTLCEDFMGTQTPE